MVQKTDADVLLLLARPDCGLCEEMAMDLGAHPDAIGIDLQHADVDSRPDWQRRYGLRVPVLLDRWNDVVCEGRFDAQAFADWRRESARREA